MGNKRRKVSQIMRANEFNDELKALQCKIENCIMLLHHLIGVLSNGMKAEENRTFFGSKIDGVQSVLDNLPNVQQVDENQTILRSKMDGVQSALGNMSSAMQVDENQAILTSKMDVMQSTLCDMVENAKEVYTPVINAPAPCHTVRLDFGNTSTPEGC